MAEDIGRKGGRPEITNSPFWQGADVERSGTHGTRQVDGEKEGGPCGPKRRRWMDDTWQPGKGGLEDDKTEEWPTLAKHRAAEKGGVVQASSIRAR
jgi:hypothetical protein